MPARPRAARAARHDDGTPLTTEDLVTQRINLVVAGHETTASSLAWALEFIHRDLAVAQRLTAEVRSLPSPIDPEALARLPYLEAACHEPLRINPVAPMIGRTLRRPLTPSGWALEPGDAVGVGIIVCHRRPELYPVPERFLPDRFLERTYSPFEFMPFGGGARRCLGAAFALYEMKLVLATILRRCALRLASPTPSGAAARSPTVGPACESVMQLA